jgi:hypothetical protein
MKNVVSLVVLSDVSEDRIASIFRVEESVKMEAIRSSETSIHTRTTWRHIPESGILLSHRHENLKSYILNEHFEDHLSASSKLSATITCFYKLFINTKSFYNLTLYYPSC